MREKGFQNEIMISERNNRSDRIKIVKPGIIILEGMMAMMAVMVMMVAMMMMMMKKRKGS